MIQILLLQDYNDSRKGDIISVSNNVAFGLEEKGIARRTVTKDSFEKTELGETKAFRHPPSRRSRKQ